MRLQYKTLIQRNDSVIHLTRVPNNEKQSELPFTKSRNAQLVGWLIVFYPQGPRKGIFASSKAHVSPPTHILSDQGDRLVVRREVEPILTGWMDEYTVNFTFEA